VRSVAIVGYGKVARELHRPAWMQLEKDGMARVVAVYEPSKPGADLARQHWPNANVVRQEATEIMADVDAEVVDVCTPGHTHAALVVQAARTGHSVLVEKPLCHSSKELQEILDVSEQSKIAVYHTRRYGSPIVAFDAAVRAGRVGEVKRIQLTHHARHILNEAEWVTGYRPDGMLFENAIHNVDLGCYLLGITDPLEIEAARFYEAGESSILTGVEFMAHDSAGRTLTLDLLQDSLSHSSFESRIYVSATGADAELRFSPSGFRLLSGVPDPFHDLGADAKRLGGALAQLARPRKRATPHLTVARDILNAIDENREPELNPRSVRPSMQTVIRLSELWMNSDGLNAGETRVSKCRVP
jgi:predicted dehydrogenase